MERRGPPPPALRRLIGQAITATTARAPWLWPVLRRPVQGYFDRLAPDWDERFDAGGVKHLAGLAAATAAVSPTPERVLDVGTGTGEAALFLAREFPRASVRGIDLSDEMIRSAQAKVGLDPEGRIAFRVADAADLPYGEESFDLITLVNMPAFLAEIARVLRPDGHVIVVASGGPATPFYTPSAVLARGFRRHGVEPAGEGEAEGGIWWLGRKAG
jgi:ubiquinone/menaquinone biosynthesis C-methylase UbiE